MTDLVLRCSGRPVGDDLRHADGEVCGRAFKRSTTGGGYCHTEDWLDPIWTPLAPVDDATYRNEARAKGWSIGPNNEATCPACRKPSAGLVKDCKALADSTSSTHPKGS